MGHGPARGVVALGARQEAADLLDERSFLAELDRSLEHKPDVLAVNQAAFLAGVDAVRALAT